jgi:hypothetical protein
VIRPGPLLGALITAAVAAFLLAAYGGSREGTVVAKTDEVSTTTPVGPAPP